MPVELAETPTEGDVLLTRDLLVTEQQDAAVEEAAVDLVELGVAERLGEIDTLDFGAQGVAQRTERKGHGDLFGERAAIMGFPRKTRNPCRGMAAAEASQRRLELLQHVAVVVDTGLVETERGVTAPATMRAISAIISCAISTARAAHD